MVLKLLGVIDWSWWWVTLPFWGGIALVLAILAIIGIFVAVSRPKEAGRMAEQQKRGPDYVPLIGVVFAALLVGGLALLGWLPK